MLLLTVYYVFRLTMVSSALNMYRHSFLVIIP